MTDFETSRRTVIAGAALGLAAAQAPAAAQGNTGTQPTDPRTKFPRAPFPGKR